MHEERLSRNRFPAWQSQWDTSISVIVNETNLDWKRLSAFYANYDPSRLDM